MTIDADAQTVTITPTANGPYEVKGTVRILAPDGTTIRETSRAYLCRCGHSKNKPFCDSSHRRADWHDTDE
ncbi:MAG: CDGSH iron-sulfur domain-containing protein [Actinobacteria bacterium]|nr:CDGSH iron-sulfur domain-containing protein [Actinomycetota bacterium]